MKPHALCLWAGLLWLVSPVAASADSAPVSFAKHRIGHHRTEAVAVADFNGDDRLDILAGAFLYLAPDWKATSIRSLDGSVDDDGKGYYDDFMNLPLDVDQDGKVDLVTCGWFCKCIRWHRNTFGQSESWPVAQVVTNGNFETGDLLDIDGDRQANEILAHTRATIWFEPGKLPSGERGLIQYTVSDKPMNFGGGVGDINGDGRPDILRPDAWFEAPEDIRNDTWIEHPWGLGAPAGQADHTPQILVLDVNVDGHNDVITSRAHKHGIFWYEQRHGKEGVRWIQHLIDDTWSQPHSLALGDINGDGTPDLITGKRFMAHNGSDPDAFQPLGVYWYELKTGPQPSWKKHPISYNEGIGSGINLCAVDLDGDGDIDLVLTGKWGGPVFFENQSK